MSNQEIFNNAVKRVVQVILGHSALVNLCVLAIPLYTLQIFDRVLQSGSMESLAMLGIGAGVVTFAGVMFESLRRRLLAEFGEYFDAELRPVVTSVAGRPGIDRDMTARLDDVVEAMRGGAYLAILDAFWVPVACLLVFMISPVIGSFVVMVNVMLALTAWY